MRAFFHALPALFSANYVQFCQVLSHGFGFFSTSRPSVAFVSI